MPSRGKKLKSAATALFALIASLLLSPILHSQLSTPDRFDDPGFWPTKPGYPLTDYVGPEACAGCHSAIQSTQISTSMALTAKRATSSNILLSHPGLKFSTGPYNYSIRVNSSAASYDLSVSGKKLQATLSWAFGTGRVGQSFLFERKYDTFREARVTYFSTLQNLGFTPARQFTKVNSPEEAMYRVVGPSEVKRCFGCHTTAAFATDHLDEEHLLPGVTCEACHGPGAKHVSTMQAFALAGASPSGPPDIFNPASLSPSDAVDFCGACHATTWDVILAGTKGVSNTRSQPYRLQLSKCWGKGDARLLCWSCHDPHQQIRAEPESYDKPCLNCHASSSPGKSASAATHPACPVATSKCVTCHMPKFYVPEMHYKFTDHRIRITKPNEPYQE
jgi:hypothetical protein